MHSTLGFKNHFGAFATQMLYKGESDFCNAKSLSQTLQFPLITRVAIMPLSCSAIAPDEVVKIDKIKTLLICGNQSTANNKMRAALDWTLQYFL